MKSLLIGWAATLLIQLFTDNALDKDGIEQIKKKVRALETTWIDKAIKHQQTAELIRELSGDLSDTVIDWTIRTVLWWARATAK